MQCIDEMGNPMETKMQGDLTRGSSETSAASETSGSSETA